MAPRPATKMSEFVLLTIFSLKYLVNSCYCQGGAARATLAGSSVLVHGGVFFPFHQVEDRLVCRPQQVHPSAYTGFQDIIIQQVIYRTFHKTGVELRGYKEGALTFEVIADTDLADHDIRQGIHEYGAARNLFFLFH